MKGGGEGRLKRERGLNNFLPLKGGDLTGSPNSKNVLHVFLVSPLADTKAVEDNAQLKLARTYS